MICSCCGPLALPHPQKQRGRGCIRVEMRVGGASSQEGKGGVMVSCLSPFSFPRLCFPHSQPLIPAAPATPAILHPPAVIGVVLSQAGLFQTPFQVSLCVCE